MRQYQSQAVEQVKQLATGGGNLASLYVANVATATRYVWVFDNTASSGTVLCGPFPVGPGQGVAMSWPEGTPGDTSRPQYSTGLRVASSSTFSTFTASGGSDFFITAAFA